MISIWDRKIEQAEAELNCYGEHAYNARHFIPGPLDQPGTDAYFDAVLAACRREAAARARVAAPARAEKPQKTRLTRLGPGQVSSGQLCAKCDRKILPGESLFAQTDQPYVVCADCQPKCQTSDRCAVAVVSLEEAQATHRRKSRARHAAARPVLVRVVAV